MAVRVTEAPAVLGLSDEVTAVVVVQLEVQVDSSMAGCTGVFYSVPLIACTSRRENVLSWPSLPWGDAGYCA